MYRRELIVGPPAGQQTGSLILLISSVVCSHLQQKAIFPPLADHIFYMLVYLRVHFAFVYRFTEVFRSVV